MPAEERELTLRDYLQVLARQRLLILITVGVVTFLALAVSLIQKPVYEATTDVLPQTTRATGTQSGSTSDTSPSEATQAIFLTSPTIRNAVQAKLGHAPDVSIGQPQPGILSITAKAGGAAAAAHDANTYALVYQTVSEQQAVSQLTAAESDLQQKINQLNLQLANLNSAVAAAPLNSQSVVQAGQAAQRSQISSQLSTYSTQLGSLQLTALTAGQTGPQVISRAAAPASPVRPKPIENVFIGIVAGLVLGVIIAFFREYFGQTIDSTEDLEALLGDLTVVGVLPEVSAWKDRREARLISSASPHARAAEAYRTVRVALKFLALGNPVRSVQITSPLPLEGKTTTSANLAVTASRAGERVLVLSCDLRRPRLHEFFGLTNDVGLTTVLIDEVALQDAIQWSDGDGEHPIAVLASGPLPPNPSELLASDRMAKLVRSLVNEYDLVLVDGPPVLPVVDALILSGLVDATLILATVGKTKKHAVERSLELLHQVDAPVAGGILNAMPERYGYGYGYGYGMSYESSEESADTEPHHRLRSWRPGSRRQA
jgi:capsular exopolysaccharide synthesis family protein